jgi:apolipoprotein D and lipocalin family protein
MFRSTVISALTTAMLATAPAGAVVANAPVASLDLQRYAGQWHEIAHLPMFFQRQCVDQITATYTANPDGSIGVHNACRAKSGKIDTSDGVARRVSGQPGALKVRFAPRMLAWLPWVWADYWVIELDPDYRWAVVGTPSRKYLWVLSRALSMDAQLFRQIRERVGKRGYAVNKLVMTAPLD